MSKWGEDTPGRRSSPERRTPPPRRSAPVGTNGGGSQSFVPAIDVMGLNYAEPESLETQFWRELALRSQEYAGFLLRILAERGLHLEAVDAKTSANATVQSVIAMLDEKDRVLYSLLRRIKDLEAIASAAETGMEDAL